jgi:hypothetical protein
MLDGAKGESYEGQMQGRQRHGYGTLTYRDGSTYEGFWRLDRKNGHGELQSHCVYILYKYSGTGC